MVIVMKCWSGMGKQQSYVPV